MLYEFEFNEFEKLQYRFSYEFINELSFYEFMYLNS